MSTALTIHPEWNGDWQMPAGIQEANIDPATGQLAQADATTASRAEIFINGTSPGSEDADAEDMAQDSSESNGTEEEENKQIEPASLPESLSEPPKPKPTPKSRDVTNGDANKLEGTITVDVDPTTNLIAVDSCPVIRTKTFMIGQEPRKYCGPEYHKKPSASPQANARARAPN